VDDVGGAGCVAGGLGAARAVGRGQRCRGAGCRHQASQTLSAWRRARRGRGRRLYKNSQNSQSAFWTQYATQYADLLHEHERSPVHLFYILFIFNTL